MNDQLIMNDPSKKTGRGKQIFGFLMVLLVLVLGIGIGTLITDRAGATGPGDSQLEMQPAGKPISGPLQVLSQAFEEVSKNVSPAVVNIDVETIVSGQQGRSGVPDIFDFFGSPFENPGVPSQPRDRVIPSLGSGVIVDPKGYIITNNHVVENATKIRVSIGGNPEVYTARVIGADPEGDIAVIKIDGDKPFPYAKIGNSQSMKVGDWVVAIGSPFGLEQTVTAGIISATGRTFAGGGPSRFSDYLQTDASINSGNSGGPLVNMSGEVVGINSFINTGSSFNSGSAGIGFAVPSHVFVRIYNQILETGRFSRGWLGIGMNNLPFTPALAEHFGVKQGTGALVTQLLDENSKLSATAGPAAKAGIKPEDVIVEFDGARIKDNQDLMMAVANTVPGKTAKVKVVRHGEEKVFDVVLAERTIDLQERPQARDGSYSFEEEKSKPRAEIGLEFDNVSQRLARAMDIQGGALVTSVKPGSMADEAGLAGQGQRRGNNSDVIVAINGKPVTNRDDLLNIVRGINSGSPIVIKFLIYTQSDNTTSTFYTSLIKP
ncbi:MAG: trypsin-like peptidase domain-containing protein [Acidobacteria bacterium]|nr:trypsin-like peptidase domain-containing protein [Acidobacteriota bacterium]